MRMHRAILQGKQHSWHLVLIILYRLLFTQKEEPEKAIKVLDDAITLLTKEMSDNRETVGKN
jgi:hypothetical protein